MRKIKVFAPAKLNLYLNILGKRPDGFHNIETIFEKIDLLDEITIKEKGKGLKVKVGTADCGQGKKNIVYKAVQEIFKEIGVTLNLDIEIKKNIPVSAGLGGGSSDAASALKAINDIFKLGIPRGKLLSIATGIGKDVPFFMMDASFAIAKGAGEQLKKINLDKDFFHVVIKPPVSFSTKSMYEKVDRCGFSCRTHSLKPALRAIKNMGVEALEKNYYNAFENVLGRNSVYIDKIKALLAHSGAEHSLLSGSGSSVFCTFRNKKDAEKVFKKITKRNGIRVFCVKTYKGGIYGDNRG
jgi:4-diphosphocytidyl-2-C-methyl-D-erythritol kinase